MWFQDYNKLWFSHCNIKKFIGFAVLWVQCFMGSVFHGFSGSWVQWFMGSVFHGFSVSWVQAMKDNRRPHPTMQPWDHETMHPCNHATMQPCNHATMHPCTFPLPAQGTKAITIFLPEYYTKCQPAAFCRPLAAFLYHNAEFSMVTLWQRRNKGNLNFRGTVARDEGRC